MHTFIEKIYKTKIGVFVLFVKLGYGAQFIFAAAVISTWFIHDQLSSSV
jgi:hypothetical protein